MPRFTDSRLQTCPECGAPARDNLTCWEQLGCLLAWEYYDQELLAAHFLTVASYNLQHPAQFIDEAWAGLRDIFIEHLDTDLPVEAIRHKVSEKSAGSRRVLKPAEERQPVLRRRLLTIAEVYIPDQPQGAAARVRAWAVSIRHAL